MIVSIGIDLIEVRRISETLVRTLRFADRVFTDAENEYCRGRGGNSAQHYAARFAAKEAMLKALGTGWSGGIAWRDIDVRSRDSGAPFIALSGVTKRVFDESGANVIHLSMSHCREYAIAQVTLEKVD